MFTANSSADPLLAWVLERNTVSNFHQGYEESTMPEVQERQELAIAASQMAVSLSPNVSK